MIIFSNTYREQKIMVKEISVLSVSYTNFLFAFTTIKHEFDFNIRRELVFDSDWKLLKI